MRVPELDGIRGIAASGVVLFHVAPPTLFWYWAAMDLFFVLSAYLIGSQLIKVGISPSTVLKYFKRRVERIWPPYMVIVGSLGLLAAILSLLDISQLNDPAMFWRYATFTQLLEMYWLPYEQIPSWPFATHLWSLAVEEQFYIFLPLLILILASLRTPALQITVLIAMGFVGIYARASWIHFYSVLHHLDAFALGIALALFRSHFELNRHHLMRCLWAFAALGLLITLPYLAEGYWRLAQGDPKRVWAGLYYALNAVGFNLFWFCMFALVMAYQGSRHMWLLRARFPVYLGRISYCLYLVHYPIFWISERAMEDIFHALGLPAPSGAITSLLCLPLVFLLAHVFYKLIDKKLQEGRALFPKRNSKGESTTPQAAP